MTDNEIIKALECCVKSKTVKDCKENGCPASGKEGCYYACATESNDFIDAMLTDALDLINRQKERDKKNERIIELADKTIKTQSAEIERLQHILLNFMNETEEWERKYGVDTENIPQIAILSSVEKNVMKRIKFKVTQEITKKIHTEIKNAIENNYKVKREHQDNRNIINDEFVMYVDGKIHALCGIDDYVDNLLKEMVGDDNA